MEASNYIFKIDSKTGKEIEVPISKEERIALIERVNKLPGEMNLDKRIFLSNKEGERFARLEAYRPDLVPKTKDWVDHWNKEKRKFYSGLLIDDEFYITGDHYWYLNYIMIPDKVKKTDAFPRIFDTDIWYYQLLEKAELTDKFSLCLKKRQCLHPDSIIYTPNGLHKIKDLCDSNYRGEIYSYVDGEKVIDHVEDVWVTKTVDSYLRVKLHNGQFIDCTDNHPILTQRGWVEAGKLTKEDEVYLYKDDFGNTEISQEESKLVGYFLADGSFPQYEKRTPKFTNNNNLYHKEVEECVLKCINNIYVRYAFKGNGKDQLWATKVRKGKFKSPAKEWFYERGLCAKGKDRILPQQYMTLNKNHTALLLNRFFAADGWIHKIKCGNPKSKRYEIGTASMCLELLHQFQILLHRFNISSYINFEKNNFFKLRLSSSKDVDIFLREIGIYDKSEGKQVVQVKPRNKINKSNRIKRIEKVNKTTEVYDLRTRNSGNFYANGIVVHNSGFTLKVLSKALKGFWFQKGYVCRIGAYEEKPLLDDWDIIQKYYNHLHSNTPWKRHVIGSKFNWTQYMEMSDGTKKGLGSKMQAIVCSKNPAKLVGGKIDEIILEEAGIFPNMDKVIGFAKAALMFGDILAGQMHIIGAVGELKQSEPLKEMFYAPNRYNLVTTKNIYSGKPDQDIGIFVPEQYSYGSFIDKYGNSLIEESIIKIDELAEVAKQQSFQEYMIYKSQKPKTPEDAFASREDNIFSAHIIQPHYDNLVQNYKPLQVTLETTKGGIIHKIGSKYPIVEDFPVKRDTIKHGSVVIDEAPILNPPFGLYYAGVDTITPIKSESISLQSIHIYKASHELEGEYQKDKLVAWYCGRTEDPYDAYRICRDLIQYYNARALIENNNRNFIEWMVNEKQQKYMMKRSEVPIGKDLILRTSTDTSDYGLNVNRLKDYLLSLVVEYVDEEIETEFKEDGTPVPIYGVRRIPDKMLLYEMLNFSSRKNVDRISSFQLALLAAKTSTSRGLVVKSNHEYGKVEKKSVNYKEELGRSVFKRSKLSPVLLRNTLR